jgi:hypothetical protein
MHLKPHPAIIAIEYAQIECSLVEVSWLRNVNVEELRELNSLGKVGTLVLDHGRVLLALKFDDYIQVRRIICKDKPRSDPARKTQTSRPLAAASQPLALRGSADETRRSVGPVGGASRSPKMLAICAAFSVPQVHSGMIGSARLQPSGVSA